MSESKRSKSLTPAEIQERADEFVRRRHPGLSPEDHLLAKEITDRTLAMSPEEKEDFIRKSKLDHHQDSEALEDILRGPPDTRTLN
ncbi:MAG: hypothetical protein JWN64_457 [Parcubacteria group bacterium]|nr:hypothetical protein [Parcubacteria group bacterium]